MASCREAEPKRATSETDGTRSSYRVLVLYSGRSCYYVNCARYLAGCLRAGGRGRADVFLSKIDASKGGDEQGTTKRSDGNATNVRRVLQSNAGGDVETFAVRNPWIHGTKIYRVSVRSLTLPPASSSSAILQTFDLLLVLCGPEELKAVSDCFPASPSMQKKRASSSHTPPKKGGAAVMLLAPYLRLQVKAPEEIAFESRTKEAGAMLFNGAIGFDVVRHRASSADAFDIFEPLWNGRLVLQRMEPEQQKAGGVRFLNMIEASHIRVDYRSGVWKSIWGTAIFHTSIHAASALTPQESVRGLLSRRRTFRRIVAELMLESERVVLAAFRDPRGRRQWEIDISACVSGALSFVASTITAVDVLFRLPNCAFAALFRLVAFDSLVPGALTSAQRDVNILCAKTKRRRRQEERNGSGGSTHPRNGLVCVRALRKISELARKKNVSVPVTNRVLSKLVCNEGGGGSGDLSDGGGGDDATKRAAMTWKAVLADDGNDFLSRCASGAFETAFKLFLKALFVCVFAIIVTLLMDMTGLGRGGLLG